MDKFVVTRRAAGAIDERIASPVCDKAEADRRRAVLINAGYLPSQVHVRPAPAWLLEQSA